jgi:hypothetical protein
MGNRSTIGTNSRRQVADYPSLLKRNALMYALDKLAQVLNKKCITSPSLTM